MARKTVYSGRIIGLSVHDVVVGGRRVRREVVEHGGAAAVLGLDSRGRAVLVRQHRYPHGMSTEVPAGTLERGEDPKACAAREMEEETGYRPKRLSHLVSFYPSIGYNTEVIHCYAASGLSEQGPQRPDDDESIEVVKVGMGRLVGMVRAGRVQDAKTIITVMTYAARKGLLS